MSTQSISCVIPVRNGERFLAEAIASALRQTYIPSEIIVVLDGSTDRSANIAESFGAPIRTVSTQGLGPAGARNAGVVAAQGSVVAFLDCDDVWLPTKLDAQIAALDRAGGTGVCVCGVENFWMEEVEAERVLVAETRFARVLPGYCGSALAASKTVFDRLGIFDPERRHTDLVKWIMRAEANGYPTQIVPEPLVRRRRHAANLTRVGASLAREEFLELVQEKLRDLRRPVGPV